MKGVILFCNDKGATFLQAAQYIVDNGGSGLIVSPTIVDDLFNIAEACQGIACVVVDIADADKICQYYDDSRYNHTRTVNLHLEKVKMEMWSPAGLSALSMHRPSHTAINVCSIPLILFWKQLSSCKD